MKINWKTLSAMALAGLVVLGSCKKNEDINDDSNSKFIIRAGINQPDSGLKTSGTNGTINWSANDKIMVSNGTTSASFTLSEGAGTTSGTFQGPAAFFDDNFTGYVTAAYPAGNVTSISGSTVTFSLPEVQTLTEQGFGNGANPMVAYGNDVNNMTFGSVCGGLYIKLQGNGSAKTVDKMVLTSTNNEEMLWGTCTVDANEATPTAASFSDGSNAITVNMDVTLAENATYDAYVMLPAGTLQNGFTIEVFYSNLSLKTATSATTALAMEVNKIKGTVTYNFPADIANAGAPASQQELNVLLSQIEGGSYTGAVNLNGGSESEPLELDFGGATLPDNIQVVVEEGANLEISNLNASTTTAAPAMVIKSGADVVLTDVALTSTSNASNSRAINIVGDESGNGVSVTLDNCTIEGGTSSYSRGLNVWSDGEEVEVTVSGGNIHAGHYAVNIPTSNHVTINLRDATIASGWAAINVWGSNNTVNATNCTLRGTNDKTYNEQGWNNFATIAFNNDNVGCTVSLQRCNIIAEATTGNKQYAIRMYTGGNNIHIDDDCTLSKGVGNPNTPTWYCYYPGTDNTNSNWYISDETFEAFNTVWGVVGEKGSFNGKPTPAQVSEDESSKR